MYFFSCNSSEFLRLITIITKIKSNYIVIQWLSHTVEKKFANMKVNYQVYSQKFCRN